MMRAKYAMRARTWEDLLRKKNRTSELDKKQPPNGEGTAPPPTADQSLAMSVEEWKNAGLGLLMLLAQAYYKMLESTISTDSPCTALDLELNHCYFWTIKTIRHILDCHPDFKDFPMKFEPLFEDLYPETIMDVPWDDGVKGEAENFLCTVQKYVFEKGFSEPEENSPAWIYIERFRPGINDAIECATAYQKRMFRHYKNVQAASSHDGAGRSKDTAVPAVPTAPDATPVEHPQAPVPPATEEREILDLCRTNPNQAFLLWKSFEADLAKGPCMGQENERKFRAMQNAFQEWFEGLGHWRNLNPNSKDLAPTNNAARAKCQEQINAFVAERQGQRRVVEYDEVRPDHKCQHEGDAKYEQVDYKWFFTHAGEPQCIISIQAGNMDPPHDASMKRHYFKNATPCGYAIAEEECVVYFRNGNYIPFILGFDGEIYPIDNTTSDDYELRKVGKMGPTLEAVYADVKETKEITRRLPGAIANVEKGIESMQPHIRGVPKVMADLEEARLVPEEAARELFFQIHDMFTPEEQRIWNAVRNAGTQKGAIALLRESDIIMSEATLSRRVKEIDEKLKSKGLPSCKNSGPRIRFTKSGGYTNAEGKAVPEELSSVEADWADDPVDRDTTIHAYLTASPEDKAFFQQTKPGIEEEANKYLKRR